MDKLQPQSMEIQPIEPKQTEVLPMAAGRHILEEEECRCPLSTTTRKVAAEFIGTFILVFIVVGLLFINKRINLTSLGTATVVGAVVTALVYTVGHISGCHLNPAATIGLAAAGQFPWEEVPFYVMAQVVSATLASAALRWLFDGENAGVMVSVPSGSTSTAGAFVCEIVVTFVFMFTVCGTVTDARAFKELAGIAIGAAAAVNVVIAGTISGPSMNPARSIGPAIITAKFSNLWIYIIAPIIGAIVASTMYNFFRTPDHKKKIVKSSKKQMMQREEENNA